MCSGVSCSGSFFVLFEAEFYVFGASGVVGSVVAEEHVDVVGHCGSKFLCVEIVKTFFIL